MSRTEAARPPFFAAMLAGAMLVLAAAGAARACPPEIMFDPVTGQAQGQADLEAALTELTRPVEVAEAGR
jgi:hypothetical protein